MASLLFFGTREQEGCVLFLFVCDSSVVVRNQRVDQVNEDPADITEVHDTLDALDTAAKAIDRSTI